MKRQRIYRLLFFLGTLAAIFFFILWVRNLLTSFVIASVFYFLLSPARDTLERKGLHKAMAAILPFTLLSIGAILILWAVVPPLTSEMESIRVDFPKYLDSIQHTSLNTKIYLSKILPIDLAMQITSSLQNGISSYVEGIFKNVPEVVSSSLTILFLAPLLSFFMLLDGRNIIRKLLTLVPNNLFELSLSLNHQISTQMGDFIRARLWETVIYTGFLWVSFLILDFPFALLLAVVGGIMNIIPYVGPIIGAIPAFLIASAQGLDSTVYAKLLFIYASAQIFDMVVIIPFLVAKIVNLHPVTVVLSVIVGSQILGVLGMIISLPVASTIKITISAIYKHLTGYQID